MGIPEITRQLNLQLTRRQAEEQALTDEEYLIVLEENDTPPETIERVMRARAQSRTPQTFGRLYSEEDTEILLREVRDRAIRTFEDKVGRDVTEAERSEIAGFVLDNLLDPNRSVGDISFLTQNLASQSTAIVASIEAIEDSEFFIQRYPDAATEGRRKEIILNVAEASGRLSEEAMDFIRYGPPRNRLGTVQPDTTGIELEVSDFIAQIDQSLDEILFSATQHPGNLFESLIDMISSESPQDIAQGENVFPVSTISPIRIQADLNRQATLNLFGAGDDAVGPVDLKGAAKALLLERGYRRTKLNEDDKKAFTSAEAIFIENMEAFNRDILRENPSISPGDRAMMLLGFAQTWLQPNGQFDFDMEQLATEAQFQKSISPLLTLSGSQKRIQEYADALGLDLTERDMQRMSSELHQFVNQQLSDGDIMPDVNSQLQNMFSDPEQLQKNKQIEEFNESPGVTYQALSKAGISLPGLAPSPVAQRIKQDPRVLSAQADQRVLSAVQPVIQQEIASATASGRLADVVRAVQDALRNPEAIGLLPTDLPGPVRDQRFGAAPLQPPSGGIIIEGGGEGFGVGPSAGRQIGAPLPPAVPGPMARVPTQGQRLDRGLQRALSDVTADAPAGFAAFLQTQIGSLRSQASERTRAANRSEDTFVRRFNKETGKIEKISTGKRRPTFAARIGTGQILREQAPTLLSQFRNQQLEQQRPRLLRQGGAARRRSPVMSILGR